MIPSNDWKSKMQRDKTQNFGNTEKQSNENEAVWAQIQLGLGDLSLLTSLFLLSKMGRIAPPTSLAGCGIAGLRQALGRVTGTYMGKATEIQLWLSQIHYVFIQHLLCIRLCARLRIQGSTEATVPSGLTVPR